MMCTSAYTAVFYLYSTTT